MRYDRITKCKAPAITVDGNQASARKDVSVIREPEREGIGVAATTFLIRGFLMSLQRLRLSLIANPGQPDLGWINRVPYLADGAGAGESPR